MTRVTNRSSTVRTGGGKSGTTTPKAKTAGTAKPKTTGWKAKTTTTGGGKSSGKTGKTTPAPKPATPTVRSGGSKSTGRRK